MSTDCPSASSRDTGVRRVQSIALRVVCVNVTVNE